MPWWYCADCQSWLELAKGVAAGSGACGVMGHSLTGPHDSKDGSASSSGSSKKQSAAAAFDDDGSDDELERAYQESLARETTTSGKTTCASSSASHDAVPDPAQDGCKALRELYAQARAAVGTDGLALAWGDDTRTRPAQQPVLIQIDRSLKGNRCKVMQAIAFELGNVVMLPKHRLLTQLATTGRVTQVEFVHTRERLEYDVALQCQAIFEACRASWDCPALEVGDYYAVASLPFGGYILCQDPVHLGFYAQTYANECGAAFEKFEAAALGEHLGREVAVTAKLVDSHTCTITVSFLMPAAAQEDGTAATEIGNVMNWYRRRHGGLEIDLAGQQVIKGGPGEDTIVVHVRITCEIRRDPMQYVKTQATK